MLTDDSCGKGVLCEKSTQCRMVFFFYCASVLQAYDHRTDAVCGCYTERQCKRTSTVFAASTVVDIASIDIGKMDLWEPFRMFLLMKEVRRLPGSHHHRVT